jgi:Holliday junction resolvase RusA-like endonuclease
VSALLVFVVEGRPVSWQRTNVVNGRPMTDKGQRSAKLAYSSAARAALGSRAWDRERAYRVEVDAYYPNRVRGDIDRIPGLMLDAMQGIVYEQDRQVTDLVVRRRVSKGRPRVEVRVWAGADDEAEVEPDRSPPIKWVAEEPVE